MNTFNEMIYLSLETFCNKRFLKLIEASWACIKKWAVLLPQRFDPKDGPIPSYTNIVWSWLVLWSLWGEFMLVVVPCNEHLVEMESQLGEHRGYHKLTGQLTNQWMDFWWIYSKASEPLLAGSPSAQKRGAPILTSIVHSIVRNPKLKMSQQNPPLRSWKQHLNTLVQLSFSMAWGS